LPPAQALGPERSIELIKVQAARSIFIFFILGNLLIYVFILACGLRAKNIGSFFPN
jgi:hypothetical protein